jgi:putative transposase
MNMDLTLRLRVRADPQTEAVLRETIEQYTASFNRVCAAGWEMRRVNGVELHHQTYTAERAATALPAQLVCSARVKATEALASCRARQRKGRKVSCPRSRRTAVRYDARSAKVRLADGYATLASVAGRQRVSISIPPYHRGRVALPVASSDLRMDRRGRLWLHVVVQAPEPKFEDRGEVVGIDLGVACPAVTSPARFLGQRRWREVEARYFRLRRQLQAKGTRSAKRHLKRVSGRQERFRRDCDHVLSKRLVQSVEPGCTLALEDLTDIRTRVRARRRQRRRLHSWSFARLLAFTRYKAALSGVAVVTVDARYTSQRCSRCGHRERGNRSSRAEFRCRQCGLSLHADLNAARNIRANHLASLATRGTGGPPSTGLSCRPAQAG